MTQRSLAVLIVLNVVLLAAIALTYGPVPKAQAQFGAGKFVMIAGSSAQSQQQIIYIVDTGTGNLVGLTVNSANGRVEGIGKRQLAKDLQEAGGR